MKDEVTSMNKATNEVLRAQYTDIVTKLLAGTGEEVLRVKSGEIAIPVVDRDGEDNYVVITIKVPTGSRDGTPYDGHGEAQSYAMDVRQKAERAEKAAADKAKKIERDKAYRAKQAEQKARREGV